MSKNPPHRPHASEDSFALWMTAATPGLIQTLGPSLKNARDLPRSQSPSTNTDGLKQLSKIFPALHLVLLTAAFQLSLGERFPTLSVHVLL